MPPSPPQHPDTEEAPEASSASAWLDAVLRRPLPPDPADPVLDLLAPVLDSPLPAVDRPAGPTVPDLLALHRAEVEGDYVEPPVSGAGEEPPIPARFAAGLPTLPHIDFPA